MILTASGAGYLAFGGLLIPAVVVMLIAMVPTPWNRVATGQNDFAHLYIGGLLFGTPDLYSQHANVILQQRLIGDVLRNSYFVRPAFYAFLLKPLTLFSYRTAYLLFQAASIACFAFFFRSHVKRLPELTALSCLSVPLLSCLINGQDVTFLLLFCSVSLVLTRKRCDFMAGLVLSLCAIKVHLFILIPIAILLHKRYRIIWGGLAGCAVLSFIGLTAGGLKTQLEYLRLLRLPASSSYSEIMPNLRNLVHENNQLYFIGAVLCLAFTAWLIRQARDYEAAFGWALVGGLLASFHAYAHDCLLLLLAYALINHPQIPGYLRGIFRCLTLPFAYVALMAGAPYSAIFPLLLITCLVLGTVAARKRRIHHEAIAVSTLPSAAAG